MKSKIKFPTYKTIILLIIFSFCLTGVVFFAGCIGIIIWHFTSIFKEKEEVGLFCNSVSIGDSIEDVMANGDKEDFDNYSLNYPDMIFFYKKNNKTLWYCSVRYDDGKVIDKWIDGHWGGDK